MPRRELQLPPPPRLPDRLPFEDQVSRAVDRVLDLLERDPVRAVVNRLVDAIPVVREREYPTPLGTYKTPEFYVPKLSPAKMDGRQRQAFKAAVMTDVAGLIEAIPGLGALAKPLSDAVEDTAYAKIQDSLTPQENTWFKTFDKVDPLSVIAMLRTMVRTGKEP